MSVEYSDASTDMMLNVPGQAVLLAGGVAFGSTDRMDQRLCSVAGCDRDMVARGWCPAHYMRWKHYGDPTAGGPRIKVGWNEADRFWTFVDKSGGPQACWRWQGLTVAGYGSFHKNGTHGGRVRAHRYAFELLVGPIPDGLQLDHLCRVPACVNPAHLEPVTPKENTRRSFGNGAKTHCPAGHVYDDENTYRRRDGARQCRACHRDDRRRRAAS